MKSRSRILVAVVGCACASVLLRSAQAQSDNISPVALQQIAELLQEKESRTLSHRKLGSRLVYALKESAGQSLTPGITSLAATIDSLNIAPGQGVLVEMR